MNQIKQTSTLCALLLIAVIVSTTRTASAADGITAPAPCPPGWICPAMPILSPATKIGAWYLAYYEKPDHPFGHHWRLYARYQPVGGYFDSGDPLNIRSQFAQMKAAGIDYVILDHANGIGNHKGEIENNVKSIFDTNDLLPADRRLRIAIALGLWTGGSTAPASLAARLKVVQEEADHVWNTYASRPSYLSWQGKPLLVEFGPYDSPVMPKVLRAWNDPRFIVRHMAHRIDISKPLVRQYAPEGLWGAYVMEPQLASPETIAVQPGYDRAHTGLPALPSLARENGARYMRQWLFAIKHRPQNIIIANGWNDFAEETMIAPAVRLATVTNGTPALPWVDSYGTEVPDWYVQITSAYTHLRTGLMANAYYRDEDSTDAYKVTNGKLVMQTALPHGHPVILLPAGTLKALLASAANRAAESVAVDRRLKSEDQKPETTDNQSTTENQTP